jgi:hypothetical protein
VAPGADRRCGCGLGDEYSDVRLELEAEDPKTVELALINAGIDYQPGDAGQLAPVQLAAGRGERAVRLQIVTPQQRRNRLRRDEDVRLTSDELQALLDGEAAAD